MEPYFDAATGNKKEQQGNHGIPNTKVAGVVARTMVNQNNNHSSQMLLKRHRRQRHQQLLLSLLLLLLLSLETQSQPTTTTTTGPLLYRLLSSEEIHTTLLQWQADFPNLVSVYTAQDEFDLPTAGDSSDCPFDSNVDGCLNYYAVIQDKVAHPLGSPSSNRLPTVLLSGELHGNERVGPTAVMETARLLLEAATCEALPTHPFKHLNQTLWQEEMEQAIECRGELQTKYGMSPEQRRWLARLVTTRRVLVVPTANALGYYQDRREENGIDPNRDFPYDLLDPTICMQTVAARTMNELFRHYLIMTSFTFHGGTELLGYEWGNPSWYGYLSPDDVAQDRLAQAFSTYGGGFRSDTGRYVPEYLYGDMNTIIYYVRGGFEDYAYAGSWDTERMPQCRPDTYGGYPAEKTTYDDGMLRAFNMLVETSLAKTPRTQDMGTSWQVLFENNLTPVETDGDGQENNPTPERNPNGHVARNIRLSMAAIDTVQPYLSLHSVNNLVLKDDLLPLHPRVESNAVTCWADTTLDPLGFIQDVTAMNAILPIVSTSPNPGITLQWTVGGTIEIDLTMLWVALLDPTERPTSGVNALEGTEWLHQYYCNDTSPARRLDPTKIRESFASLTMSAQSGDGFFSVYGARPASNDPYLMGPVFETMLDLQQLNITKTTKLLVIASAQVDNAWTQPPTDGTVGPANTGPQSHMVQSRTNDEWYHINAQGHVIQGQSEWFSEPIILEIQINEGGDGTTQLVNDRYQFPILASEEAEGVAMTTMMPSMVDTTSTIEPTFEPSLDVMDTMSPSLESSWTGAPTDDENEDGVTFFLKQRKEAPPPKCLSLASGSDSGGQANKDCSSPREGGGGDNGGKRTLKHSSGIQEQRQRQATNNKRRLEKLRGENYRIERP